MKLRIATAWLCLAIGTAAAPLAHAQWHATVGAQSHDMGMQALAFLPNEMWIHAGDSITWTFDTDEIHTVTFLVQSESGPGEAQPPFFLGCPPGPPPGATPDGSSFDGSNCVNAGPSVSGQTFTVNFPAKGNYKLICLVHQGMTGTIHVLDPSSALPHNQDFYDEQAAATRRRLLYETHGDHDRRKDDSDDSPGSPHDVTAGRGATLATPGGHQSLSIMRFMQDKVVIHAGDTVEWGNDDPATPHTVTFGVEPADPVLPSGSVPIPTDPDGALHATITSSADNVHSGLLVAEPQDAMGNPQAPLTVTRFRVTFTTAGVYPFKCALHDNLGMLGQVIVRP